jgi:hypothetical protein
VCSDVVEGRGKPAIVLVGWVFVRGGVLGTAPDRPKGSGLLRDDIASSEIPSDPNRIVFSSSWGPNELEGVGTSDNDDVDRCLALCESDSGRAGRVRLLFFGALPSVSLCDD